MQKEELIELLSRANKVYYNSGESIMEDAEYDRLKEELEKIDPNNILLKSIGEDVRDSILQKREHKIPMGSQSKVKTKEEFYNWASKFGKDCVFHASHKMDGGSVSLEYENGLKCAITRGDGKIGEDITANALKFAPKSSFKGFARGEIILETEDWKTIDPDLTKNPRNLGNGICRRKSGVDSEYLKVFVFGLFNEDGSSVCETEEESSKLAEKNGFITAPYFVGGADSVWKWFEETEKQRATLPFWIDGIVVKINDITEQKRQGELNNRPKGQIAIKFSPHPQKTTLRNIEWTGGHTGAIIPTAIFDSVFIDGSEVSKAYLCNIDEIKRLDIAIEDEIEVYKANDIIPKISRVLNKADKRVLIHEPDTCPICGAKTFHKVLEEADSVLLYCSNPACEAKSFGKIKKYAKSLDILGLGDEVIKAILPKIKNAAGLYKLTIEDLIDIELSNVKLGEKRAKKILKEIEKKKELTLSEFLGALGIDGLGKRRVELIQNNTGKFDFIAEWLDKSLLDSAEKAGIPNLARIICESISLNRNLIHEFLNNGIVFKSEYKKEIKKNALSFCITGEHSIPRKEMQDLISNSGNIVKNGVSQGLDFLVIADVNSQSSKAVKARKLGTKLISEEGLKEILNEKDF
jgi:DNA ligase (NAD+)